MIVIAAGPVANFLLAWLIYVGLALTQGAYYRVPETGSVMEGSPAAMAGLTAGDVITHVNGEAIWEWPQLSEAVQLSAGAPLTLTLVRGDTERTVTLTPREAEHTTLFGEKIPGWQIGVVFSGRIGHRELGPLHAVQEGCRQTWGMIAVTGEGIVKLIQRVVPMDAVGGPILIAQAVGQQAREGADAVLLIAALISVNLGLLNLLPIPILDGGLLVFMGLELLFRRPINARVQEASARVGLALLIGLMLFATWNDIMRLLS
jgi:regulator of sigma E protease